jgi:hypothetical protein
MEQRCWLDWWANSTTNLGGFNVSVTITATPGGWEAHGHLTDLPGDEDERDAFPFLCDLDPVFTLRFDDGSAFQVIVNRTDERRFTLIEYTGPASREVTYRMKL